MDNRKWNNAAAADVISDILKMRENIKSQQIFAMNNATKEKIAHGSTAYDGVIEENNNIPDGVVLSFVPSVSGVAVPGSVKIIQLSEEKLPEIKRHEGNRKQRREAERERKRRMKKK